MTSGINGTTFIHLDLLDRGCADAIRSSRVDVKHSEEIYSE